MQTIQASEADFPSILDEVERGETVVITRDGRAIARVSPESELRSKADPQIDHMQVRQAMERIREISKRTKPVSIEEILSARDEGRM